MQDITSEENADEIDLEAHEWPVGPVVGRRGGRLDRATGIDLCRRRRDRRPLGGRRGQTGNADDPAQVQLEVYVSEPSVPTISPAVRDLPDIVVDPLAGPRDGAERDDFGFVGRACRDLPGWTRWWSCSAARRLPAPTPSLRRSPTGPGWTTTPSRPTRPATWAPTTIVQAVNGSRRLDRADLRQERHCPEDLYHGVAVEHRALQQRLLRPDRDLRLAGRPLVHQRVLDVEQLRRCASTSRPRPTPPGPGTPTPSTCPTTTIPSTASGRMPTTWATTAGPAATARCLPSTGPRCWPARRPPTRCSACPTCPALASSWSCRPRWKAPRRRPPALGASSCGRGTRRCTAQRAMPRPTSWRCGRFTWTGSLRPTRP